MVLNRKITRRRRLLVDSSTPLGEASARATQDATVNRQHASMRADVRPYAIGAQRRHQRKTTDLIPKRPLACAMAAGLLAAALVLLNLLAASASQWATVIGSQGAASFDIRGIGTLAGWWTSIVLLMTAAVCWQVYVLRQHRSDDYQGSYRIWILLTAGFVIASLASQVGLGSMLENLISHTTSISVANPGWLPVGIGVVVSSLLLARYLLEVRQSYGTVSWSVAAWVSLLVAMTVSELRSFTGVFGSDSDYATGNALMIAASAGLLANLTYARFVFLRANGLIQLTQRVSQDLSDAGSTQAKSDRKTGKQKNAPKQSEAPAEATNSRQPESTTQPAKRRLLKRKSADKVERPVEPPPVPASTSASQPRSEPKPEPKVVAKPAEDAPKAVTNDASEKLKRLAAASRARQLTQLVDDDEDQPSSVKMSKAQRKRQRKLDREQRRAA